MESPIPESAEQVLAACDLAIGFAPTEFPPMFMRLAVTSELHDSSSYRALRAGAGVVDRSALGKLALTGPQAAEMLNGQVSNDVEALAPGTGCYAALLTNKGKMLGDLRVLNTGDELLLLTERALTARRLTQEVMRLIRSAEHGGGGRRRGGGWPT